MPRFKCKKCRRSYLDAANDNRKECWIECPYCDELQMDALIIEKVLKEANDDY